MVRVLSDAAEDDGSFDLEFWRKVCAEGRLAAVWQMVGEARAFRGEWALNPDFRDLLSAFSDAEVRFLVVGAHAVSFYAVPRYTKDIDLWIDPTPENTSRTWEALARFGAPLDGVTAEDLAIPGTVLQVGVEPNRIDILTCVAGLEFSEAWSRRVTSSYGRVPVSFPCLDDLLASKRACGRPQDLVDAEWLEMAKRQ